MKLLYRRLTNFGKNSMRSYVTLPLNTSTHLPNDLSNLPHAIFELWADRLPEAVAVVGEGGILKYAELEQRSNQIAHALRASGVQRGDLVAIFLERGLDLVCALLGVLKSGAAFAALDPRLPKEVLTRILTTVDSRLLLTHRDLASALPSTSAQTFFFEDHNSFITYPVFRPAPLAGPDDSACVLFTSGSEGHPKAVLYRHRNLTARLSNTVELSGLNQSSVFGQSSPVTSIDSIDEIFLPLVTGGCTAILPYDTVTNPHKLIDSLSVLRVTHILLVPSLLRVILSTEANLDEKLSALKTWMVGGEPLTGALVHLFYKRLSAAVLINYYGLTEGDATCYVTSAGVEYDSGVPIGRPVRGTKVYLLDELLRPVPEGTPGEIYLAGEGLFHEYLNRPELNAERWVSIPLRLDRPYGRLFRTGDIGQLRADGELEYLGRSDRMVKVRGFRVELGEVEAILSQHPAVDQCVIGAKQSADSAARLTEQTQIVAYAVLKQGESAASGELRDFLKDRLSDYALPATVLILDSFPLSPNGKVNLLALPEPTSVRKASNESYVPPRDAIELELTRIWEDLLESHPMGVTDSFFEVGGDSLAAIDLMLTIEKEFHLSLPITTLIQSPTIAAFAGLIRGEGKSVSSGSLVPIRVEGARPPLFCVHADGSVFIYRRFVEYLDANIPLYGLQAHGLANPKDQPYRHVDEMAAHYIREMRTVQPHGPYYLCAFSAGGLIIFEMARQLQAQGEQVAFLGLLDAYGPDFPEYLPNKSRADYKISVHWNTLRLHGLHGQVIYLFERARHRVTSILSRLLTGLLLKLHLPMPRKIRYEYIAGLIDRAVQLYPGGRTYSGEVTLFRSSTQPEGIKPDPTLGWSKLVTRDLKIVKVVGTHNSIMRHEPHVADLVRKIDQQLSQLHNRSVPKNPSTN
jgi:amino acid adenylation domain-containing protein